MNLSKTFKKNPFVIGALMLCVLIFLVITLRSGNEDVPQEAVSDAPTKDASLINIKDQNANSTSLSFEAQIQAQRNVALTTEASGKVANILVSEGDTVSRNDIILSLNNADQQLSYRQALVQLESQELELENLQREFNKDNDTVQNALSNQQEAQVQTALSNFLNNDLRAYPEDDPQSQRGLAPSVEGSYNDTERGQYVIEVYPSSSPSGASFRYSGLESGTETVSTNFPVNLGSRGLSLQFPENFGKNETWVIEVPNTRSSSFVQAQNSYNLALESKESTLQQSKVTQKQIDQQRNVVAQQRLSVAQAQERLEKTRIRAPFDGQLVTFNIEEGEIVSTFQPVGTVKSLSELELEFSVSSSDAQKIRVGDTVMSSGEGIGEVSYIAQSLDETSFKTIARASLTTDTVFTEGENISIRIPLSPMNGDEEGPLTIPLSSVTIIGNDPFVGAVVNGAVELVPVERGLLLGSQIEIISGLEAYDTIVRDIRGYQNGDVVKQDNQ